MKILHTQGAIPMSKELSEIIDKLADDIYNNCIGKIDVSLEERKVQALKEIEEWRVKQLPSNSKTFDIFLKKGYRQYGKNKTEKWMDLAELFHEINEAIHNLLHKREEEE